MLRTLQGEIVGKFQITTLEQSKYGRFDLTALQRRSSLFSNSLYNVFQFVRMRFAELA